MLLFKVIMEALGGRLKLMVKTFRRECHRVLQSERTTIHGADGMLMVLQLATAEVNKQVTFMDHFLFFLFSHVLSHCIDKPLWPPSFPLVCQLHL